jgi:hypothetical protein
LTQLAKQAVGLKESVATVTADLAQADRFARVTGAALIKFGRIDALVNNAGVGQGSVRNIVSPSASGRPRPSHGAASSPSMLLDRSIWHARCCPTCWRRSTVASLRSPPASEQWCEKGSKAAAEPAMGVLAADLCGSGVTSNVLVLGGATDRLATRAEFASIQVQPPQRRPYRPRLKLGLTIRWGWVIPQ